MNYPIVMPMRASKRFEIAAWGIIILFIGSTSLFSQTEFWKPIASVRGTFVPIITTDTTGNIFVATDSGLFRSQDKGQTWQSAEQGLPEFIYYETSPVSALITNVNGDIFAGTHNGVYHSTDHGDHWTRLTTDLVQSKNNIAFSIAVHSRGHIYAGGYSLGVYRSFDDGKSWEQINSGLSNLSILALAFSRDGHLFAGTRGGGAFRSAASTTSVQAPPGESARSYSLEQNFPNPAHTHTGFSFFLPQPGYVYFKIYTLVGEEVMSLTENFISPGRHFVQLRTDNLANGVYLLRMQTREFSATRKVLIIK